MADFTGYLAPDGLNELGPTVRETYGNLVLAGGATAPAVWAANVWRSPAYIPIVSIGDAAKRLRAIQRNWALYSFTHHRRAALIAETSPMR